MLNRTELQRVIEEVIAPQAAEVDAAGIFPKDQVAALAQAGLLAITVPTSYGGGGLGPGAAVELVRELSRVCGSTAMVAGMHFAATAALVADDQSEALTEIAEGRHLTTLAFSEFGSRSHFWAPGSSATAEGEEVLLDARKSWVTSAANADSYVWSSRPMAAEGPMTLWYVRTDTPGLDIGSSFDGLGLRGNGSVPVIAESVRVPRSAMIGADGQGLDFALGVVLPWFLLVNSAASVGLMEAVTGATIGHAGGATLQHLGQTLAQQPTTRAKIATMQITTDRTRALVDLAVGAVEAGAEDAPLRVLEAKACADEASATVADLAMAACGGAAFRKELSIERRFRDSRAARVMAPTHDALLDFIGRAVCGLPLLDAPEES